jgi:hypothetical protein
LQAVILSRSMPKQFELQMFKKWSVQK